ncbi:MAG: ADP-ribosylglycohydrolase family protein [Saprospiraceae bacterium]|nr:ADP-ribosylglycohydrolase family protein [Lewinella sp.]
MPFQKLSSILLVLSVTLISQLEAQVKESNTYQLKTPDWPNSTIEAFALPSGMNRDLYYDKVLGALVGSAIGDAMGAPTEMWHRDDINTLLGYVDSLDLVIREGSPEGPWAANLPAGGTTDDTRWKYLLGGFLSTYPQHQPALDPKAFAKMIVDQYERDIKDALAVRSFDPAPLEKELQKKTWLQEWAKVAKPFFENDLQGYSYALNRFYGGEMACAGMLYAPLIGAYYPGNVARAYTESYRLGIFDLGYARDITGLTAAYVAQAMQPGISFDRITLISRSVDPLNYSSSRLVGRIAFRIYRDAKYIVHEAKSLQAEDVPADLELPKNFKYDPLYYGRMQKAFELLDDKLQDIPFHAAEIHLINLTALEFGQGDFARTIEFVVNYGRDNDTVAAVTGAILGAYLGFSGLPDRLKERSLRANKELLGISLEQLAQDLTEQVFGSSGR